MESTPYDFGPVARLDAESQGPPGQRTFRLLVTSDQGTASLWLEKEDLQTLGLAIEQFLAQLSGRPQWKLYGAPPAPYQPPRGFPLKPLVELKVGQLSIGYEDTSGLFVLLIHDVDADPDGPASFTCLASSSQLEALSRRIESIIAAGRPRCPLCGDPMDRDRHACIRSN